MSIVFTPLRQNRLPGRSFIGNARQEATVSYVSEEWGAAIKLPAEAHGFSANRI
jgi:hypothetical protein